MALLNLGSLILVKYIPMKICLLQLVAMFGLIIRLYAADSNNVMVLDTKYHDLPLDCSFSITSRIVNVCSKHLDNIDVTSACGCIRIVSCRG
jgi:hypothetical protein